METRIKTSHFPDSDQLSILMPVYNEEDVIEATIRALYEELSKEKIVHEILVINDRSSDKTENLLQKLLPVIPTLRYVNNILPQGFGYSVRYGLSIFNGDAVCLFMADQAESPKDVVNLYRKLQEGYDCVFGSRFIKGGSTTNYPRFKFFVNRLANLFISSLFLCKYNDTTNAFKIYRRSTILGLQPLQATHFNITVELPLKALIRGYKYAVLPHAWQNKKDRISKLKLRKMGARYLFVVLCCFLEKFLTGDEYKKRERAVSYENKDK
jgi:dolichol-phosphate mannosyltransferase